MFFLNYVLCFFHLLLFCSTSSKAFLNLSSSTGVYPKSVLNRNNNVRVSYSRVVPLPFEKELGVSNSIVFQNKFFDPLHLATEERFVRYRESELKHGRVAMLATMGLLVPDCLLANSQEAIASWNHLLALSDQPKLDARPRTGIQAILSVPRDLWIIFIGVVAILELFILRPRSSRALPGDYATGFFGVHDYGKHENLLQQELEYGRLAMIGFVVQILWEIITNTSVVEPYRMLMNYVASAFH
jgi:hypothetical protein